MLKKAASTERQLYSLPAHLGWSFILKIAPTKGKLSNKFTTLNTLLFNTLANEEKI